ncbi:L-threonylcarbamoyladenylate synthase [Tindallia californiensis]|uniref:Threonylcarbamoyl-AMP synthase n=1 Tax=Tindallia californiensis TaxID=159292 RepID=A0A1H3LH91_9FIRM|nr:L-threonylcarbamoyladenylate synthase [Tindallia californiensis]SDY63771.1 translation factor SUA5 [Tindallia californiensis]
MKNTRIEIVKVEDCLEEVLEPFAEMLAQGKTVAFPTETVYGLGANALDEKAVQSIFEAKGRPSDNPLIVHIAQWKEVLKLAEEITPLAKKLAEAFWPGPLTLILKKKPVVPESVTAGLDTVALRMPSHQIAHRLIAMAGVPVAAPSANLSGKPSPTRGSHVIKDLKGRVDGIIDGGMAMVGLESTVVDATGEYPVILRPGGITKEQIMEAVKGLAGSFPMDQQPKATKREEAPRSPGMKYAHYAPNASVVIVQVTDTPMAESIRRQAETYRCKGHKVGILCTEETLKEGWPLLWKEGKVEADRITSEGWRIILNGSLQQPSTIAERLFDALRSFDETEVTLILAEAVSEKSLGQAIMNRLQKASNGEKQLSETREKSDRERRIE